MTSGNPRLAVMVAPEETASDILPELVSRRRATTMPEKIQMYTVIDSKI